jgi:phosphoglycolate phosphatase (TIGR01487 family)
MGKPYREIPRGLARRIKLIMTDVDGTLLKSGEYVTDEVAGTIRRLQESGITVGLVSGRTVPRLENLAAFTGASGPIIAENGGVARLKPGGESVDLGYSRRPALKATEALKNAYPGLIKEKEDNRDRLVDVAFQAPGIMPEELKKHIRKYNVQLLDSGYMLHLLQKGISKGKTLEILLERWEDGSLSPDEVAVFGDSLTDISLFEMFPNNVRIVNPGLPEEQVGPVREKAAYVSSLPCGEGFIEVAGHIISLRAE